MKQTLLGLNILKLLGSDGLRKFFLYL